MKLKDLKEFITSHPELEDETPVILVGEYNYGADIGKPYVANMSHIDGENIVSEDTLVVAISSDSYVYESEDLGYSDMWVDKDTLNELKVFWADNECEEDEEE
jgi:hypothetical protein